MDSTESIHERKEKSKKESKKLHKIIVFEYPQTTG